MSETIWPTGLIKEISSRLEQLNSTILKSSEASDRLGRKLNWITAAGVAVALSGVLVAVAEIRTSAHVLQAEFEVGQIYKYIGDGKFELQRVIDFKDLPK